MSELEPDLKKQNPSYLLKNLFLRRNRLSGLYGQRQAIAAEITALEAEKELLEKALREQNQDGANIVYSGLLVRVPSKNEIHCFRYETYTHVT